MWHIFERTAQLRRHDERDRQQAIYPGSRFRSTGMSIVSTKLRDSLYGLLRRKATQVPAARVERIRKAMLLALDQAGVADTSKLERSLLLARDIDALWHARPTLMNAVAARHGEAQARKCLADITSLFKGFGPGFPQRKTRRKRTRL